jgi:hypothetical protein
LSLAIVAGMILMWTRGGGERRSVPLAEKESRAGTKDNGAVIPGDQAQKGKRPGRDPAPIKQPPQPKGIILQRLLTSTTPPSPEQLDWEKFAARSRAEGMEYLKAGKVQDASGVWNAPLILVEKLQTADWRAWMLAAELAYCRMYLYAYENNEAKFEEFKKAGNDSVFVAVSKLKQAGMLTDAELKALPEELKAWRDMLREEVFTALPKK